MVQAKPGQLVTFEDLLAYEDGTDRQYELTYGELVEVPPETYDNLYRARKLDEILRSFVGLYRVVTHGAAIATYGQPKNRFPDLMVLQPEHPAQMRELGRAAISLEMSPPMLIVEVVSPGAENRKRDYVDKRAQYERREVPEYWIIDPIQNQVVVLWLTEKGYEETTFKGSETVLSFGFSQWPLTAAQMISADPA